MKVFWYSRRKMQRSKGEKQRWRSKPLSQYRPIRKTCPALTGFALFLSFFLSFQTQGFFSFCKPRCLVYKDQRDCTDINIKAMAALYHSTCSGLTDEYTRVHGTKPFSQVRASGNGLSHRIPLCTCTEKRRVTGKKNWHTLLPIKADAVPRVS